MSSEMIERVARVLNKEVFDPEVLRSYGDLWTYKARDQVLEKARAAIKAMREPTDAMINAGISAWLDENTPSLGDEAVIRLIFEVMMNEALK